MNTPVESTTSERCLYSATYSPDDNKLRLYALHRLPPELYQRVKAAGFRWAPKQGFFVAPMWTPGREDLLIELCGEIDDEDTSLAERAEERADRFEHYSERRAAEAERAHDAVKAIADSIPFGQPILIGHHSERRARKDAERIQSGMRRTVRLWKTSEYWTTRANAAVRHAKYKERPDVRQRRIKKLEADQRVQQRRIANTNNPETIAWAQRWLDHIDHRLVYERAMLAASGGTAADQTSPEVGGGCKCWASPRGGWSYIQKVNRVSVTVLDNYGNGGKNFRRTIPFDELRQVMSAAQVQESRAAGLLLESDDKRGFYLRQTTDAETSTAIPDPE